VTYTGTNAAATVGHGLGVAPSMIITKSRNNTYSWGVYHASLGVNKYLLLDSTAAEDTASGIWGSVTSSTFGVGAFNVNGRANTYVAYCFAEVAGYSRFGSYTGNGSTDGPFVFCGFRPKYVLVKCSSNAGLGWVVNDGVRNPSNVTDLSLFPNLSNAENSGAYLMDFTSNGFKVRTTQSDTNNNGYTFIFAAFAEFPQKFSLAR
jgi:hypothetical protein